MTENQRTSGRSEPFASILYAEPGALGLMANIISALVVAVSNMMYGTETKPTLIIAGVHLLLVGGFLQLSAGLLSFRRNDHLTGTAFIVFSALWSYQGIIYIITKEDTIQTMSRSVLPGLIGFIAVAIVLFICSLFVNYIMPPVLAAMILTLVFEGIGLFYVWGKRVAAAFELFIALTAIYAVVVMTTKGVSQRYVLPGFGNAPIDPLLIKARSSGKKKHEKKKITKYAEPMGMGYIGNIVPSVLLCFYHLGYFSDFRPASAALACSFLCHIVASYYAFLREDFFHCIQFISYFLFFISRGSESLLSIVGYSTSSHGIEYFYGSWGIIFIFSFILFSSLCQNTIVFVYNLLMVLLSFLSFEHIPEVARTFTFGITSAVIGIASVYISVAHLLNSIAEKEIVFVGPELVSSDRLRELFSKFRCCLRQTVSESANKLDKENRVTDTTLNIIDSITFIANAIAAISLSPSELFVPKASLTWLLVAGVVINIYCARLSYAAGSLSRSLVLLVLSCLWATWSLFLFGGVSQQSLKAAAISVLCLHTIASLMTSTFTKFWMFFSLTIEVNAVALIVKAFDTNNTYITLVTSLIVGITGLYGALSGILKETVKTEILPQGDPIIKQKKPDDPYLPCPALPSRKTEAIYKAAEYLNEGHVIGAPTDTVYGLIASCKHPESISAIYHIKGRPPEKPICLCVADIDQLKFANPPFSDLLWTFMHLCYPGGITCVVHKGDWLRRIGVGDAIDYIGTKDSVAIRVPDSTVLSYLLSISGPVALTSANPSGEVDSTHHDMVIDRLGTITFFRIGCVPQDIVEGLFERAKGIQNSKSTNLKLSSFSLKRKM